MSKKKIKKNFQNLIIISLCIFSFQAKAVLQDTGPYELKAEDKKLNNRYQSIIKRLSKTDQIKLRKAQRLWIAFCDADCAWSPPSRLLNCLIDRTVTRTNELGHTYFYDKKGNYLALAYEH